MQSSSQPPCQCASCWCEGTGCGCRLWSATTWRRLATLTGHEGKVMGGDICPDGSNTIASVSYDKTVKIWAPDELAAVAPMIS